MLTLQYYCKLKRLSPRWHEPKILMQKSMAPKSRCQDEQRQKVMALYLQLLLSKFCYSDSDSDVFHFKFFNSYTERVHFCDFGSDSYL